MKDYNFYTKIEAAVMKNPKANVVNGFASQGTTVLSTSWCCYSMSCLVCCCCSKAAAACIDTADVGSNWKNALTVYNGLTPDQTRKLFLDGMRVLHICHNRLGQYITNQTNKANSAMQAGNTASYSLSTLTLGFTISDYNNGMWLNSLMKLIKDSISLTTPEKYVPPESNIYNLNLSEAKLLIANIGFLYPVCQGKYNLKISAAEMVFIRKYIDEYLSA